MKLFTDYELETRSLMETLAKHNFTAIWCSNGEGKVRFSDVSYDEFLAELHACDEATLIVKSGDGRYLSIYLVYGNSYGELAADWSQHPALDKALDEHSDKWYGMPQSVFVE